MENDKNPENKKLQDLESNKVGNNDYLTTNQGVRVNDDHNSLLGGERGPTLMEDFIFREKMTHFDHERIPERIVHARGTGAHGHFELYESMSKYTKAGFLNDTSKKTPVFVRFSTVVGFKGSTDLARDVRGFAVKFYTEEGNYDLVGNNIPVFFIQDAMKFPDLVHSIKPEPDNEIPQASAAHDTFWDFISLMPESMHMIMWVMSDRAIPRSYRTMEGFGVHTFRFINKEGKSTFVKFHWKPVLGVHSVLWDEAQKISGKNSDFHRQDLWEAIEEGQYPEYELGVQLVAEEDEHKFDFDLLDPTKIIPEELVPVKIIGKMTLTHNVDNFFAETEQVAFHPGHVVPGIDFTNDPLLQGRLFSYIDTQLIRLGGPNFHELPINRPIAPKRNNQRDGFGRQEINKGKVSYSPNSLGGGCPFQAQIKEGGFHSFAEKVEGNKIRTRSQSFLDHFGQAKLFYDSQTEIEQKHMVDALGFELGKVNTVNIRERMVGLLTKIDKDLAAKVAGKLGIDLPIDIEKPLNHGVHADAEPGEFEPIFKKQAVESSKALSMLKNHKAFIKSRKIGFLCDNNVSIESIDKMKDLLVAEGAMVKIIGPHSGTLNTASGKKLKIDQAIDTTSSVLFDAIYIPEHSGEKSSYLNNPHALNFLNDAFQHCKPISLHQSGMELFKNAVPKSLINQNKDGDLSEIGVFVDKDSKGFLEGISKHRYWNREQF